MARFGRPFTVKEFHRIAEVGIFRPEEHVELVDGIIRESGGRGWRAHVTATKSIYDRLREALRDKASVYSEVPLALRSHVVESELKPDVLVCAEPDESADGPPRTKPLLVVDVADWYSVEYCIGDKAAVYAESGVPEYWVLNLAARVLVILRKPMETKRAYFESFGLNETLRVSPEAWPEMTFDVFDFLPSAKPRADEAFQDRD